VASNVFRNSDYVSPNERVDLFSEITDSWKQITNVLFTISPQLSREKKAVIGGVGFTLSEDFSDNDKERYFQVLSEVPSNVVRILKDDLYTEKMGTILSEKIDSENNQLLKLELIMFAIATRPSNWVGIVEDYITNLKKGSYYLLKTQSYLGHSTNIYFLNSEEREEMLRLQTICIVKHKKGIARKPNKTDLGNAVEEFETNKSRIIFTKKDES
jgi:hypothetical protein